MTHRAHHKSASISAAVALVAFAIIASCTSSQLLGVWANTEYRAKPLRRVLVVTGKNIPIAQGYAEQYIAASLNKIVSTQMAAAVFSDKNILAIPRPELRNLLLEKQFDGYLVVELSDIAEEEYWVPPMAFGGWYGGWRSYPWAFNVYSPGQLRRSTSYYISASLYEVATGKLVWRGQSKTVDPVNVEDLIDDVATLFRESLQNAGVVSR